MAGSAEMERRDWACMASEILALIIHKVQCRALVENDEVRRVVAMAGVCRSWRQVVQSLLSVYSVTATGLLQFPEALREPGPVHKPMQCVMYKRGSTFFLYECNFYEEGQESTDNDGNFLMGACKRWRPGHTMFMVSADRVSFSRKAPEFMGKLKSNFWGSAFVLWDHQKRSTRPVTFVRFSEEAVQDVRQRKMTCVVRSHRSQSRALSRPLSRNGRGGRDSSGSVKNFWRWSCMSNLNNSIKSVASNSIRSLPQTPRGYHSLRDDVEMSAVEERVEEAVDISTTENFPRKVKLGGVPGLLKKGEKVAMFTSKIPEWDVQRQCWTLQFQGRATLPSMHNFQLLLPDHASQFRDSSTSMNYEQESVVLQLGKMGKGVYALDYRYPLSAFQAFNIALSSFATTVGLEP